MALRTQLGWWLVILATAAKTATPDVLEIVGLETDGGGSWMHAGFLFQAVPLLFVSNKDVGDKREACFARMTENKISNLAMDPDSVSKRALTAPVIPARPSRSPVKRPWKCFSPPTASRRQPHSGQQKLSAPEEIDRRGRNDMIGEVARDVMNGYITPARTHWISGFLPLLIPFILSNHFSVSFTCFSCAVASFSFLPFIL